MTLMTLTKKQMVHEIGRCTRLKNRDVQAMLETLVEVWTAELVEGSGRIELEGLFVLKTRQVEQGVKIQNETTEKRQGTVHMRRVFMRLSRTLRKRLRVPGQ